MPSKKEKKYVFSAGLSLTVPLELWTKIFFNLEVYAQSINQGEGNISLHKDPYKVYSLYAFSCKLLEPIP